MKPYVVVTSGGWLAYSSIWAYLFGREPILRARTWGAMKTALDNYRLLKTRRARRRQERRALN